MTNKKITIKNTWPSITELYDEARLHDRRFDEWGMKIDGIVDDISIRNLYEMILQGKAIPSIDVLFVQLPESYGIAGRRNY